MPDEEKGRSPALPEIAEGDSKTPGELAASLAQPNSQAATKPILNALERLGARVQVREHHQESQRCDLILLVDQLDEIFAASVSAQVHENFAALLNALAATGRVWVASTLRADLYEQLLKQPGLKALKEKGASLDLAAPGLVEMAEIIRRPAQAAGLVYEKEPASGERLDERLLREAGRPDMLPLVQLALSGLYDGRENTVGETRLTFKRFESLGGLKGIIAEAKRRSPSLERARCRCLRRSSGALPRSRRVKPPRVSGRAH